MVERSDPPSRVHCCALRLERGAIHVSTGASAGVRGDAAPRSKELRFDDVTGPAVLTPGHSASGIAAKVLRKFTLP